MALKPKVQVQGYGSFLVKGSKDYKVTFSLNSGRELMVSCDCVAGKKANLCCFHMVACSSIFKLQARLLQDKAAA
jgi:uncharacterized Zn finger protein